MSNAIALVAGEFQPLVPPRGSVSASVEAELRDAYAAAAFHHVPSTELGNLDHDLASDIRIYSDHQRATVPVSEIVREIPGARPLDAGGLQNAFDTWAHLGDVDDAFFGPRGDRLPVHDRVGQKIAFKMIDELGDVLSLGVCGVIVSLGLGQTAAESCLGDSACATSCGAGVLGAVDALCGLGILRRGFVIRAEGVPVAVGGLAVIAVAGLLATRS